MNKLTRDFLDALTPKIERFCEQHQINLDKLPKLNYKVQVVRSKAGHMKIYLIQNIHPDISFREWTWKKDSPVSVLDEVLVDLAYEIAKDLV